METAHYIIDFSRLPFSRVQSREWAGHFYHFMQVYYYSYTLC